MDNTQHYLFLESLYKQAPIVEKLYPATQIQVRNGFARIEWPVEARFHHAAGSLHGSAYFRLLDDAAYFAASSRETDYFLLTASFELHFLRPVSGGELYSEGRVIDQAGSRFILAESRLYNQEGEIVAKGSGTFARSRKPLNSLNPGFRT